MFTIEFQGICSVNLALPFSLEMILVEASVARFACDLVRYWKLKVAGAAGLMVLSYIPGCWFACSVVWVRLGLFAQLSVFFGKNFEDLISK